MAAVVNVLEFEDPVDPAVFAGAERDLAPRMRAIPGFRAFHVVQTSEREVVLLILGDSVGVLERIATEVGSPWMGANVAPLLAAPPKRSVGPFIASSGE